MNALTISQPRHLELPEACLVTPSQLSIPQSISKEDFLAVAAKLKALGQAEDFWLADAAHFAKKWNDGLQLMAETVGRTKYHLVRVAQVAERFTPAKRFSYTVAHLRVLMPFPDEFLDHFLPSAANFNLSVKALRIRAEEEYGYNPYKPKNPKKRSVPFRADLWARLQAHAPKRVSALIERICEDWLEQRSEAPTAPVGDTEAGGNDIPSTSDQPETSAATDIPKAAYEDRRKQQIADGAQQIPAKPSKKYSLRVQWTECRGESFTDTENGPVQFRAGYNDRPTKFFSEENASEAEQCHAAECGYHELVVHCPSCSLRASCSKRAVKVYHVAHRYSGGQ
jgi:hypothetical protein